MNDEELQIVYYSELRGYKYWYSTSSDIDSNHHQPNIILGLIPLGEDLLAILTTNALMKKIIPYSDLKKSSKCKSKQA